MHESNTAEFYGNRSRMHGSLYRRWHLRTWGLQVGIWQRVCGTVNNIHHPHSQLSLGGILQMTRSMALPLGIATANLLVDRFYMSYTNVDLGEVRGDGALAQEVAVGDVDRQYRSVLSGRDS